MTYEDMNRITGNIAYLYDLCQNAGIPISGSQYSKTSWTQNDIITVSDWTELLRCLAYAKQAVNYTGSALSSRMRWDNINAVEQQTLAVYSIINSYENLPRMNHWVGDPLYADDQVNAGGRYD